MMKIAKTAFVAALLVGSAGIAVNPAMAKDKQDQNADAQQGPKLKLSNDFRKAAAPAQQTLQSGDLATAETQIAAAEAAAKTDDEKYVAAQLRLSLTAKQQQQAGGNDAASQARSDSALAAPLDALISNPVTPKDQLGKYAYLRGSIAFDQKKYADALNYYAKAQAAGYQDANMPLQIAKAKVESGDIPGGVAQVDQVIKADQAAGQPAPENLYRYAIANLYKTNDHATTLDWVQRWLNAYPTAKNWRAAIEVFGFQGPTADRMGKPQKLDLYRLMDVTDALADRQSYLSYANGAVELGLPEEAVTVIAKGKSKGVIPAGDSAAASIEKSAKTGIASEGSLDSLAKKAQASAKGDLASQTADAYLGKGDYAQAVQLYKLALQKGVSNTELVHLHLGIAEARSGDKAAAINDFAAVQAQPSKDIASLWTTWAKQGSTAGAAPAAATTGGPPQG
ncbi:MAG: hypothetical protein ACTHMG_10425 [Sphingomonas sp.]